MDVGSVSPLDEELLISVNGDVAEVCAGVGANTCVKIKTCVNAGRGVAAPDEYLEED